MLRFSGLAIRRLTRLALIWLGIVGLGIVGLGIVLLAVVWGSSGLRAGVLLIALRFCPLAVGLTRIVLLSGVIWLVGLPLACVLRAILRLVALVRGVCLVVVLLASGVLLLGIVRPLRLTLL